jgi:hypothetical protein
MYDDSNMLVLVNKPDNLSLLNKKRKSRWDENFKPCKNKY